MTRRTSTLTRRELLKKAVYITPAMLTLPVLPTFASSGSSGGGMHPMTMTMMNPMTMTMMNPMTMWMGV